MTEPWFDPNVFAWIPGTLLGVAGGIEGTLAGLFAPRGKLKTLVMGVHFAIIGMCCILLIVGIIALATGQPYGVWYGLGLPGLLGLAILGPLTALVRKRYAEAELDKSMAEDL
jgi:peptidoglycan/LPS O-acetylase OafA/YrhL